MRRPVQSGCFEEAADTHGQPQGGPANRRQPGHPQYLSAVQIIHHHVPTFNFAPGHWCRQAPFFTKKCRTWRNFGTRIAPTLAVIVKPAIKIKRVVFGFIQQGGSEIRALIPDIFPRNRGVRQHAQLQNFPGLFAVHDRRDVAGLRRAGITRKGAGARSDQNIAIRQHQGRADRAAFSPPKISARAAGGWDRGFASTQLVKTGEGCWIKG